MDSEVIAALIPTPVAALAAAAAYAAGRSQARGAYHGPVDAVRRQHQRDAYGAFLTAANTYVDQTLWAACLSEARSEMDIASFSNDERRDEVEQRALRIRQNVATKPVRAAAGVVSLEGPEHVASLAEAVVQWTYEVRRETRNPGDLHRMIFEGGPYIPESTSQARIHLVQAIEEFTTAARSHLNSTKP